MTQPTSSPRLRPVIRVFVSSTFSDMKHERNALAAEVYPKLEELCQKNGFQFQAIDLRWGVSKEAGLDHRTMRICFDELRRAQEISPEPNFLVLLGNRYGWRPLPEAISVKEFEALERVATTDHTDDTDKDRSEIKDQKSESSSPSGIRENRGQALDPLAVLRAWYRCDENVLLPEPPEADPDRVPLNYILQPRQNLGEGRDYTRTKDGQDTRDWLDVQQVLWSLINTAFPAEGPWFDGLDWERHVAEVNHPQHPKRAIPQLARFQASATEQEIWCGALSAANAERHVIACFREIANRGDFTAAEVKDFFDRTDSGEFDPAAAARQIALKEAIRRRLGKNEPLRIPFSRLKRESDGILLDASEADTKVFCNAVFEHFRPVIERQIEEYWHKSKQGSAERATRELKIEQDEHQRFGRERGGKESFVGREAELKAIRAYLQNASRQPLVVHGSSGCGKTALMWRAFEEIPEAQRPLIRLLGTTPHSSDLRGLLTSLCQELRQRNPREGALPTEIKELRDEFDQHLRAATAEEPLILFLDALDQLSDSDGGRLLNWIPFGQLPPHVKLVVSCLSDRTKDDPAGQPWAELQNRRLPAENIIDLDALSEGEAKALLFDRWLHQAGRAVSPDQHKKIGERLASPVCRQPIYLKLLFEEARLWRSYDESPQLGEDVPALLKQLFDRLSHPANHGPLLVDRVLGYLAASRHGLAENEILEILFADPEYKKGLYIASVTNRHELPASATRIPIAIWSRLRFDLAPYLTERAAPGANVLTFYHRQVAEWVQEHFAKPADQSWQPHQRLADYFRTLADPENNQSWKGKSPRPFLEVVFHLAGAQRLDEQCQTLCDLAFIEARGRLGQVFALISDFNTALVELPEFREERERAQRRDEVMRRYNYALRDYAVKRYMWLKHRLPEPEYPALPLELQAKALGNMPEETSPRAGRLRHFANFVSAHTALLAGHPDETLSLAYNYADEGPVATLAQQKIEALQVPCLQRSPRPALPPYRPQCLSVLHGHGGFVSSVCVSPNGRRAVSASNDNTLRVWDLESGECLRILEGHSCWVDGLSISPDGLRAISCSGLGDTARLWDLETGVCLRTLKTQDEFFAFNSVSISSNGLYAVLGSAQNRQLWFWDLDTGDCQGTLKGHSDGVTSVRVCPDDWRVVSASKDKTLRLWDLETGTCLRTLEGHIAEVSSVSVSPDGRRAVSASDDKTLRLWDLETGDCLRTLEGHSELVSSVGISPDGRRAVSASYDKTLRLWDLETGVCLQTFEGHSWPVSSLSVSPDGSRVVSGGMDNTLRLWNLDVRACPRILEGHSSLVSSVRVSPDGRRAVSASWDETFRVWDLGTGVCLLTFEGQCRCMSISDDAKRAVSAGAGTDESKIMRLWNLETGDCLRTLEGHSELVSSVGISPDGRRAVSASYDKTLRLWELESGVCRCILQGHRESVGSVSFTPDGLRAVSASHDNTLRVWDIETGGCLRTLKGHSAAVTSVSVTPDGRRSVSISDDKTVRVWDIETGGCLCVLEGHSAIKSVSLSPDGRRVLSVSDDGAFRLWDLDTGVCLRTLECHTNGDSHVSQVGGVVVAFLLALQGHTDGVSSVSVTPDGRRAVTVGYDKSVRLWDLGTGACLAVYLDDNGITAAAISPSDNRIVCGSGNGQMHFLTPVNCPPSDPTILTATTPHKARCPCCASDFPPPQKVISAVEACSILNRGAWASFNVYAHVDLLALCPHCASQLKFNPFFAAADINPFSAAREGYYTKLLRRGLEFSRRERGADHEETLAHLAALAALEKTKS